MEMSNRFYLRERPERRILRIGGVDTTIWLTMWLMASMGYSVLMMGAWGNIEDDFDRPPAKMPPLLDEELILPKLITMRETVIEEVKKWRQDDTATPLLVGHSFADSIEAIQAAVKSKMLPASGASLISIASDPALNPPTDSFLNKGHAELVRKGTLGLGAVWSGVVDRIFTVSPAPDLKELLLVKGRDVTFKHVSRADPEEEECQIARRPVSGYVYFNSSETMHAGERAYAVMGHRAVAIPQAPSRPQHHHFDNETDGIVTALEIVKGSRKICCTNCLSPSGSYQVRNFTFRSWKGEISDAEREKEAHFDAEQLVNAMAPVGPYVLAIDLTYFENPSASLPRSAPECDWLTRPQSVHHCILPLANPMEADSIPESVKYPAALKNLMIGSMSQYQPPPELPADCKEDYERFRKFVFRTLDRTGKGPFAESHPVEAIAELCRAPQTARARRQALYRESADVNWIKRRVQTIKMFLGYIKRNLRPPSLILVSRASHAFGLPVSKHGLFVEEEVLDALRDLRFSRRDVAVRYTEEAYGSEK